MEEQNLDLLERIHASYYQLTAAERKVADYVLAQYHQVQFIWDKVQGADKYGIAVYLAGKWRVQTSNITTNNYVTPKNLTPGMTYKVAVAARVNGKWNTTDPIKNAITVTIK